MRIAASAALNTDAAQQVLWSLGLLRLLDIDALIIDADKRVLASTLDGAKAKPEAPVAVVDGCLAVSQTNHKHRFETALRQVGQAEPGWRTVVPLGRATFLTLVRHSIGGLPVVLVIIAARDFSRRACPACLMRAFDLTAREAELVTLLVGGRSLPDAAVQLGMSVATGRTHLRHIFQKIGVSTQMQLAAVIAACAFGRCPETDACGPST